MAAMPSDATAAGLGWLSSAPGVLSWYITERPCGWSHCAAYVWCIWSFVVKRWPVEKLFNIPVFQQTTLRMLNLAQQYQAAADSLAHDCQVYGHMRQPRARSDDMLPVVEGLSFTLLVAQQYVLSHAMSINGNACVAARQVLRTLCTSSEFPRAALQALAAACVDLQAEFKAEAQHQQHLMKKNHKQPRQQHPQQKPLQAPTQTVVNHILLEMAIPADHGGVGLLSGWEDGLSKSPCAAARISRQAYGCMVAELALRGHLKLISPRIDELEKSQCRGAALIQSPVCCLGGMKLLLEAALLLQGTEPEAGMHHELQVLLHRVIGLAPKEDVVALLRERGGLIMQAVRVTEPEEFLYGILAEAIPWREREVNWAGLGRGEVVRYDWMETLKALVERLGEAGMGNVGFSGRNG